MGNESRNKKRSAAEEAKQQGRCSLAQRRERRIKKGITVSPAEVAKQDGRCELHQREERGKRKKKGDSYVLYNAKAKIQHQNGNNVIKENGNVITFFQSNKEAGKLNLSNYSPLPSFISRDQIEKELKNEAIKLGIGSNQPSNSPSPQDRVFTQPAIETPKDLLESAHIINTDYDQALTRQLKHF